MLTPGEMPIRGRKRFLSAFTSRGIVSAENPLFKCKTVLHIEREDNISSQFLRQVYLWGCRNGCPCIEFLSPLFPDQPEMILFPKEMCAVYILSANRHIPKIGWALPCLEDLPLNEAHLSSDILKEASAYLGEAKAYHDALEELYRPYIDFSRQEPLLEEHIQALQRK